MKNKSNAKASRKMQRLYDATIDHWYRQDMETDTQLIEVMNKLTSDLVALTVSRHILTLTDVIGIKNLVTKEESEPVTREIVNRFIDGLNFELRKYVEYLQEAAKGTQQPG